MPYSVNILPQLTNINRDLQENVLQKVSKDDGLTIINILQELFGKDQLIYWSTSGFDNFLQDWVYRSCTEWLDSHVYQTFHAICLNYYDHSMFYSTKKEVIDSIASVKSIYMRPSAKRKFEEINHKADSLPNKNLNASKKCSSYEYKKRFFPSILPATEKESDEQPAPTRVSLKKVKTG